MNMETIEFNGTKYWFRTQEAKNSALLAISNSKGDSAKQVMQYADYVTSGDDLLKSRDGKHPIEIDITEEDKEKLFKIGLDDVHYRIYGIHTDLNFQALPIIAQNLLDNVNICKNNVRASVAAGNYDLAHEWHDYRLEIEGILTSSGVDVSGKTQYLPVDQETYDNFVELGVIVALESFIKEKKQSDADVNGDCEVDQIRAELDAKHDIAVSEKRRIEENKTIASRKCGGNCTCKVPFVDQETFDALPTIKEAKAKIAKLRKNHKKIPADLLRRAGK